MSEDICQTIYVDGEPILVRVTSLLTPEEVEAFAWLVRAAKRKHAAEHPEPPVGAKQGSIPDRSSAPVATRPDVTDGSSVSGTPNTPGKVGGGVGEMRPSPVVDTGDEEPRACPDCEQGKHHNCDGRAWDNEADDFAPCPCAHTGHGEATARCDLSGLLVDQCACRIHEPKAPAPEYVIVARFHARFDSTCPGCGNAIEETDPIARTDDGDYICSECAS